MSFSKAEKTLYEPPNFNPPPGYYLSQSSEKVYEKPTFGKQDRFDKKGSDENPGPGSYNNDRRDKIKRRILDESKKGDTLHPADPSSEIKISSIPSIPKKSATRVYEELAPGILILHQEENENSNIGPGSYNPNSGFVQKKSVAHKINPEHKEKKVQNEEPQVKIPTIAEEIRNQKRLLYKKNLMKSTGINRSMISPADLCLEVIILRQKLLRSDDGPPPGYYYNEKYQSSFNNKGDWPMEYQLTMGKEQRWKESEQAEAVGPGTYDNEEKLAQVGGFIAKQERKIHRINKLIPGPGTYKIQSVSNVPTDPKGSYPPIFGSGCNRFYSADSKISNCTTTPGPGSYKIDAPKKKKVKYLKIKKDFYDSQFTKTKLENPSDDQLFGKGGDKSGGRFYGEENRGPRKKQKNTHNFSSKVDRFTKNRPEDENPIGPGQYASTGTSLSKQNYNRNKHGYVGSKEPRFDGPIVRPHIGPGSYEANLDPVREKKVINVKM